MENINTDTNKIEEFITSFSKDIVDYRNNITELYRLIKDIDSTSWKGDDQKKYCDYCLSYEEKYTGFADKLEEYLKLFSEASNLLSDKIAASNIGDIK